MARAPTDQRCAFWPPVTGLWPRRRGVAGTARRILDERIVVRVSCLLGNAAWCRRALPSRAGAFIDQDKQAPRYIKRFPYVDGLQEERLV